MKDIKVRVMSVDGQQVMVESETITGEDVDTRRYIFTPEKAVEVATAILRAAEACGLQITMQTAPHISSMQRMALIKRTELIMRSMSGQKLDRMAMQIVDSILAEIL